jgi:hypothetical protein
VRAYQTTRRHISYDRAFKQNSVPSFFNLTRKYWSLEFTRISPGRGGGVKMNLPTVRFVLAAVAKVCREFANLVAGPIIRLNMLLFNVKVANRLLGYAGANIGGGNL